MSSTESKKFTITVTGGTSGKVLIKDCTADTKMDEFTEKYRKKALITSQRPISFVYSGLKVKGNSSDTLGSLGITSACGISIQ
ncbi:hypothetical protein GGI07_000539 [Coemansia sp. Benny D115]|nr:hypothetical protein GGI07_000539 [Coemansia sp. Benny D115]